MGFAIVIVAALTSNPVLSKFNDTGGGLAGFGSGTARVGGGPADLGPDEAAALLNTLPANMSEGVCPEIVLCVCDFGTALLSTVRRSEVQVG